MKKLLLSIFFLALHIITFAQDFSPQVKAPLQDHLLAVNEQWKKVSLEGTRSAYSFERESQRIKIHLSLVESYLRKNPPLGLSQQQLKMRIKALDILQDYYLAERFPINHFHSKRTPYFIDKNGTACAVGHLIIESGNAEIAALISKENNFAYISELDKKYPELMTWASKNGFTIDELAWIQPGYPPINQDWNQVGNGGGCDGVVNVMDARSNEALYMAGDFSEMDGVAANNIIGWDGEDWFTLGEGVTGVIHDMYVQYNGPIFIVGDFYVNENPELVNIAYWEDNEWKGYETSNMTGSIYCLFRLGSKNYIGGSFDIDLDTMISGSIRHLAYITSDGEIKNDNQAFSVNGNVRDITAYNGNILVAGNFTKTAFYSGDLNINHFDTDYLAYYTPNELNWLTPFEHDLGPLAHCYLFNGYLGIMTNDGLSYPSMGSFGAGLWSYFPFNRLDPDQPTGIFGRAQFDDITFTYGNILFYPLIGTYSKGIFVSHSSIDGMGGTFDKPVRAIEKFQDQYYFTGDFSEIQGQSFPGIVSSPFDSSTPTHEADQSQQVEIFTSKGQLNIRYEGLIEECTLNFYNVGGQLITSKKLESGDAELNLPTSNWSDGIYFYSAATGSKMGFSGKVSVTN